MAEIPGELHFAESHEWVRIEDDGSVTVGISDHAQEALGDVVFIELPEMDASLDAGDEAGVVESVKAASDIYAPVAGTITAVNEVLDEAPETVNASPYEDGWFFKMRPASLDDVRALMDAAAYAEFCDAEES